MLIRFASTAAVLLLSVPAGAASGPALRLMSPKRQVEFRLYLGDRQQLEYEVLLSSRILIERSPIGITVDGVKLGEGVTLGKAVSYRVQETYPWYGVHSTAVNRCNGLKIPVTHTVSKTAFTLEVRAYDDGVAFRHLVPGEGARVPDEATSFRVPAQSVVWHHDFEGHYEATHTRSNVEEVTDGTWVAPPMTFKLPNGGGYGSITEGALLNYAGMGLQADGQRGFRARLGNAVPPSYPFRLRYADDIERMANPASITGLITTPWRIVMAGRDLNTLVNCDIVNNVSAPPDPKLFPQGLKTEWIKPGRAVWKYLDGGENNMETAREFTELAAKLGFEYQVVEGFWSRWSPEELKGFIDWSRRQGVGIWLWKHSRDLRDPESRRKFFQQVHDAGAVGVKIDFFDHEAKAVVDLYEECLRDAAEFHLLVNFHGANKPTGESRTYPNELTREAVRGMESRRTLRAQHDATLPFTRYLAGPADYTPMHFGERRNDTSWAHQMATAVVFTSPLLTYAAHPKNMLANPAVDLIKSIPSVWDETVVLPFSEIGEVAAFARRMGDTWFLAIVNGTSARTVTVPLSFLGPGRYQGLQVLDDAKDSGAANLERTWDTAGETVKVEMREGGGFIARFTPAKD
jgi:alpha-glucosidase